MTTPLELQFWKMNGAGNDFVMLDNRSGTLQLNQKQISHLCDRHRGVGADGVLIVESAQGEKADFRMRYYNADGGEVEMCGNGARCFGRFVCTILDNGEALSLSGRKSSVRFETIAGVIEAEVVGDQVRLAMSTPHSARELSQLKLRDAAVGAYFVNTGVPHVVVPVEKLAAIPVMQWGAEIRYHDEFAPQGANANFMEVVGDSTIAIRTYERGVEGETLACGTGTVAAALVHAQRSGAAGPIKVRVAGGDTLEIGFERRSPEPFDFIHATLTGPAELTFSGKVTIPHN